MKTMMTVVLGAMVCLMLRCTPQSAGAQEKPTPEEESRRAKVVATVDGTPITVGEIEDKIRTSIQPSKYKEKDKLKELLDSIVDQILMENEAKKRKYDELPDVVSGEKRILYNLMQTKYIEENLTLESISKEEVKAYYNEHIKDYDQPSLVRASHILVADETKAKGLLEQAKAKDFDLRKFRQLATENSEDEESKARGGDLHYFAVDGAVFYPSGQIEKEVAEAAFKVRMRVKATLIAFDKSEEADAILKEMVLGKPDPAKFKANVKKYSVDEATKKKGGDTGWFDIDGNGDGGEKVVPPQIAATAFSFQTPGTIVPRTIEVEGKAWLVMVSDRDDPGALYPELVKSPKGFHLIWVVNRKPASHKSIEDVDYSIRQRLWQEKKKDYIDTLVDDLKKKYNVKVSEENLDKVVIDLSGLPSSAKKEPPPAQ